MVIARRQSTTTSAASATFGSALQAGSVISILCCVYDNGRDGFAAPTSAGFTFVAAYAQVNATTGVDGTKARMGRYYAVNSGTTTPTITYSGGDFYWTYIEELTGVDTTTPLDATSVSTSGQVNTMTCPSITPANNGALVVQDATGNHNGGDLTAWTATSPQVMTAFRLGWSTDMVGATSSELQTTATASTPTQTVSAPAVWEAVTAACAFKAAGAGPSFVAGRPQIIGGTPPLTRAANW